MPTAPTELVFGFYSCHDHISASGDVGAWPHFDEQLQDVGAHFVIGGGDQALVADFVALLCGQQTSVCSTTLDDSMVGHRLVFLAEDSRGQGGAMLPY